MRNSIDGKVVWKGNLKRTGIGRHETLVKAAQHYLDLSRAHGGEVLVIWFDWGCRQWQREPVTEYLARPLDGAVKA